MKLTSPKPPVPRLLALCLLSIVLSGCAVLSPPRSERRATSLMNYLYPGKSGKTESPTLPTLTVPLRVGVAFVPATGDSGKPAAASWEDAAFPEVSRKRLIETVAAQFRSLPFVRAIEIIPTSYLTPGGGFKNLDQVRQLFGVDVIALLSFDQTQNTDRGILSLTYWTIVGAYVVPAEKNLTLTLLDAAVFDIPSRTLLFRAPGVSTVQGDATPVNLSEALRLNSERGFRESATNLVGNLTLELASFQQRIKERPEEVKLVRTADYRGGAGAWGVTELLMLCLVGYGAWASRCARPE